MASRITTSSSCVLNRVARDKLPRVLTHVIDALATSDAREVFSAAEKQQLCDMLALPALAEVDALVALVTRALVDAAHFGAVDRDALLLRDGVDADALAVLEKAWRKKGRAVAQQIAARHPLDAAALAQTPVLTDTNWRLHVELGQSKVRGQTDPTAIFQLTLQDPSDAQQNEKLDIELSHDELHTLFQQLNAIQAEMDHRSSSSASQANAV